MNKQKKPNEEEKRHRQVLEEAQEAENRASKEGLPGFDPRYYHMTPEEIAEEIQKREGKEMGTKRRKRNRP